MWGVKWDILGYVLRVVAGTAQFDASVGPVALYMVDTEVA